MPGSHKAALPLPREWRDTNSRPGPASVGIGIPEHTGGIVTAGSAVRAAARFGLRKSSDRATAQIIFTEACTHGTLPWSPSDGQRQRKTLFFKYSPAAISWSSDFFDPVALHAQYPDLDERALQMLEPPNARYGDRGRVLASMQPGEVGDRFNQQHTVLSQSKL